MKLILVTNGERHEVEGETVRLALIEAHKLSQASGKGYDALDDRNRVVASVSPNLVNVMPWVRA